MTARAPVRTLAAKELRALLPIWVACVLSSSIAAMTGGFIHSLSQTAFALGVTALGAQSIGHEYAHRTLGLMLTLPVDRRRLFLLKLAILGALVLPLATYAWALRLFGDLPALPWLLAAGALCLAPLMTMLCRSQLAGTVLSLSIPAPLVIVVMIVTGTTLDGPAEAERAALETTGWLMIPVFAAGAVLEWWLFLRLEAIEGAGAGLHLRWDDAEREVPTRHPLWQLVKKELRLQQMTFAVTALFVALWASAGLLVDRSADNAMSIALAVYWLGLPVLAGSLASAEERHLGTLSWQLLLPTPAWQQWAAKVGTVFILSLLLLGVPVLLGRWFRPDVRPPLEYAMVLSVLMTAASLYISSLCTTGIRAAVVSFAGIPAGLWLVWTVALAIPRTRPGPAFWSGREGAWLALVSVAVVLLVAFAFVNHRPEPPAPARIWRQTLSLAALMGFGIVILETARF